MSCEVFLASFTISVASRPRPSSGNDAGLRQLGPWGGNPVKKIVLLVVLAGLGWWYFVGGRTLTEEGVRKHYDEQSAAMARFDAEALCAMLHDDYKANEVSFTPAGPVKASVDRNQAC